MNDSADVQRFLPYDSQAAVAYLKNMQSVINHFSTLGSLCKTFSVTMIGVGIAFDVTKSDPSVIAYLIVATIFFWILNSYYLSIECMWKEQYRVFSEKLINNQAFASDLFFKPTRDGRIKSLTEQMFAIQDGDRLFFPAVIGLLAIYYLSLLPR